MKLYTEEQVRFIAKAIYDRDFDPAKSPTELVKELTPIELPSDKEIENNAYTDRRVEDLEYHEQIGFERGALWMKEQILNQNK